MRRQKNSNKSPILKTNSKAHKNISAIITKTNFIVGTNNNTKDITNIIKGHLKLLPNVKYAPIIDTKGIQKPVA